MIAHHINRLINDIVPGQCYEEFFTRHNFFDAECLKIVISKLLGCGIIAGAAFVKVPQILKLTNAKSAVGISVTSVLMELFGMTVSAAYSFSRGFPFSSWGESLFLMLETAAIAYLVFLYNRQSKRAFSFVILYSLLTYLLFADLLPPSILWFFQAVNLPVAISGKLLQAYRNYEHGHTGQLSAITISLLTGGTFLRVFTTIQETGDPLLVVTFISAALANLLLAGQVYYYWNVPSSPIESKKKAQ